MKRLLFVSHETTLSGAPIQLAYLVQWLHAHGWKTTVVAPEPGPMTEMLRDVPLLYESQLLIDPAYGALRRLAPQFDLVIANTVATWEAVQSAHLEKVPVLWYIHETRVGLQLTELIHMIEPSLELATTVVAPTRATARVYERFRSKAIHVVPYGIPAVQAVTARESERIRFVTLGTYETRKGQDVLLAAIALLTPALRARSSFSLAGRVLEKELYNGLATARAENVRLLGPLGHDAAMELLAEANVLVCPSRDETMPIVLLEAMSLGKPIVCTRVGGIEEWIRDGENGLLVRPEDPPELAQALARVIEDDELRARLSRAARATFERHFTIDQYGERFAELLRATITP